jgi:hypothetical protein
MIVDSKNENQYLLLTVSSTVSMEATTRHGIKIEGGTPDMITRFKAKVSLPQDLNNNASERKKEYDRYNTSLIGKTPDDRLQQEFKMNFGYPIYNALARAGWLNDKHEIPDKYKKDGWPNVDNETAAQRYLSQNKADKDFAKYYAIHQLLNMLNDPINSVLNSDRYKSVPREAIIKREVLDTELLRLVANVRITSLAKGSGSRVANFLKEAFRMIGMENELREEKKLAKAQPTPPVSRAAASSNSPKA